MSFFINLSTPLRRPIIAGAPSAAQEMTFFKGYWLHVLCVHLVDIGSGRGCGNFFTKQHLSESLLSIYLAKAISSASPNRTVDSSNCTVNSRSRNAVMSWSLTSETIHRFCGVRGHCSMRYFRQQRRCSAVAQCAQKLTVLV